MAEQAARRRHEDDLAALALLEHRLPAARAIEPTLRDVRIHDVEKALGRHVDDLGDVVLAGSDDKDVDAAEPLDRLADDRLAGGLVLGSRGDLLHLCAPPAAFGTDLFELLGLACGQRQLRPGGRERLRGDRAERARCAGHHRDLVAHGKQRKRIGWSFGHGLAPGG